MLKKLPKRKRGRPKKPCVDISKISAYVQECSNLSPADIIIANRYIAELKDLEKYLKIAKKDIDDHGLIEDFKQGKQKFRRVNPAFGLYFDGLRAYRQIINKLSDLLKIEIESW